MRADPAPPAEDSPSLPLYAAGLVVTLSGVMTVASELDAPGIGRVAVLLCVIGFAFSLACRRLQIPSLWLNLGMLAFVVFVAAGSFADGIGGSWFVGGAQGWDMWLAVLLMWLGVARSWVLVSDDLVLSCCVITAATIGLIGTQTPNTEVLVYFCLFVLAMTFMLIHQNYLSFRARASARERARPAGLMLGAQLTLAVLSVALVLASGFVLIVPAQAAFANLSLTQTIRRLVGNGGGRASAGSGTNRFSDGGSLDIGETAQWPTGSDVLMHVSPDDNQPHYWRGRTYDEYTGSGWTSTQQNASFLTANGDEGPVYLIRPQRADGGAAPQAYPRRPMTASFDILGETDQFYYCEEPRALRFDTGPGGPPIRAADGRIDLDGRPVQGDYEFTSLPPPDLSLPDFQEKLRADGTDYPDAVRRLYLPPTDANTLRPEDLADYRAAIADALRALPPDRRTPFDRATALRDWVANRCTYSLAITAPPPSTDRVHEFLFHTKRGYCDLFASSFVVLCRVAGIPARVATGFAPGDRDASGFNLRSLDKHAWAEVYFPSDRWQVFDPTVGTRTDGTIPVRRAAEGLWHRLQRTLGLSGPAPLVVLAVIVLLLLFVVKTEFYDRRRIPSGDAVPRPSRVRARLGDQYAQMTQHVGRLGLPRRPSETPAEYEARAVPFLSALERSLGLPLTPPFVSEATRRFVAVRYGRGGAEGESGFDPVFANWVKSVSRARRRQLWRRFWRIKG